MRNLIDEYFDTSEKRAKLYLLITIVQIWAIIALVIGVIFFIYILLRDMGILTITQLLIQNHNIIT